MFSHPRELLLERCFDESRCVVPTFELVNVDCVNIIRGSTRSSVLDKNIICVDAQAGLLAVLQLDGTLTVTNLNDESQILLIRLRNPHKVFIDPYGKSIIATCTDGDVHIYVCPSRDVNITSAVSRSRYVNTVITTSTSVTLKVSDRTRVMYYKQLTKRAIVGEFISWLPRVNSSHSVATDSKSINNSNKIYALIFSKFGGFVFALTISEIHETSAHVKTDVRFLFQVSSCKICLNTLNYSYYNHVPFNLCESDENFTINGAATCVVNGKPVLLISTAFDVLYRAFGKEGDTYEELLNNIINGNVAFVQLQSNNCSYIASSLEAKIYSHETEADANVLNTNNISSPVTSATTTFITTTTTSSSIKDAKTNYLNLYDHKCNGNAINCFQSSINSSSHAYVWVNKHEIMHGLFQRSLNPLNVSRSNEEKDYMELTNKTQRSSYEHTYEMEELLFSEPSSMPWISEQHMLFPEERSVNLSVNLQEANVNDRSTNTDKVVRSTEVDLEFINKPPLQVILTAFHMCLLYEEHLIVIQLVAGLPTSDNCNIFSSTTNEGQENKEVEELQHKVFARNLHAENVFCVTNEWFRRHIRFNPFRYAHINELLRSSVQGVSKTGNTNMHYFKGVIRDVAERKLYVYNAYRVWELKIVHEAEQQWRVMLEHATNTSLPLSIQRRCFDAAEQLLSLSTFHPKDKFLLEREQTYNSSSSNQRLQTIRPQTFVTESRGQEVSRNNYNNNNINDNINNDNINNNIDSEKIKMNIMECVKELYSAVQFLRGKFYLNAGAIEHATSILTTCTCFDVVYNMLHKLGNQRVLQQFVEKKFVYITNSHRHNSASSNTQATSSEQLIRAQQERWEMQAALIIIIVEHKLRMLQWLENCEESEAETSRAEQCNRIKVSANEFLRYAIEHCKALFEHSVLHDALMTMMESYGQECLAIDLALKTNRPRYALHRYLAQGAFSDAIRVLIEYNNSSGNSSNSSSSSSNTVSHSKSRSDNRIRCNLWYEAAPILMSAAPALFVSAILKQLKRDERAQRNATFDILHLLPLLLHYSPLLSMYKTHSLPFSKATQDDNSTTIDNADNNVINPINIFYEEEDQLIALLEEYINTYNCTLTPVHNYYLALLASHIAHSEKEEYSYSNANNDNADDDDDDVSRNVVDACRIRRTSTNNEENKIRLESFINESIYYDVNFALRTCFDNKCYNACVILYTQAHLYEDAVLMALNYSSPNNQGNWVELANIEATLRGIRGLVQSETVLKRLWLRVTECVMKRCGTRAALNIVHDSNGVLLFEDVLATLQEDTTVVEHFKEVMCSTLNKYYNKVHTLRQKQQEAYEAKLKVQNELDALQHKYSYITQRQRCLMCHEALLAQSAQPIIIYPNCQHVVHESCAIARLEEMGGLEAFITDACLPQHVLHQITDLASLARVDCVICGEAAIVEVDIPLCWDDPSWNV